MSRESWHSVKSKICGGSVDTIIKYEQGEVTLLQIIKYERGESTLCQIMKCVPEKLIQFWACSQFACEFSVNFEPDVNFPWEQLVRWRVIVTTMCASQITEMHHHTLFLCESHVLIEKVLIAHVVVTFLKSATIEGLHSQIIRGSK